MSEELEERLDSWMEAYDEMTTSCKTLMATLERIKAMAENTDIPPGDMLYNIFCEADAALQDAPTWDEGPLPEDEPEASPHLWVILTGDARQEAR